MREFSSYNPLVIFIWFAAAAGIAMFCMNPLILALSLCGSVLLSLLLDPEGTLSAAPWLFLLFLGMALINPLVSHRGATVLLVINNNPLTLEALFYGICSSAMILSVLLWFRSFSRLMSSDKLLYLFGSFSPKLALILSMALNYIPLFGAQAQKVDRAQRTLGLYSEDSIPDTIRGKTRVFSVLVTWALENGIITADSMAARGYGTGKRSSFSLYRFRRSDALMLALIFLLLDLTVCGMLNGAAAFVLYPRIGTLSASPQTLLTCLSYAVLAFLPSAVQIGETIRWKSLTSKI